MNGAGAGKQFSTKIPLLRHETIKKYNNVKEECIENMGNIISLPVITQQPQLVPTEEIINKIPNDIIMRRRRQRRSKSVDYLPEDSSAKLKSSLLSTNYNLTKTSSLYSLNDFGGRNDFTERTPIHLKNPKLMKQTLNLIFWLLLQFGFKDNDIPKITSSQSWDFLTRRKYLNMCKFVASRISEINFGHTDDEIIGNLLKFANIIEYPEHIQKSTLKSPMTLVDRPIAIAFLYWLCQKFYHLKFKNHYESSTRITSGLQEQEHTINNVNKMIVEKSDSSGSSGKAVKGCVIV